MLPAGAGEGQGYGSNGWSALSAESVSVGVGAEAPGGMRQRARTSSGGGSSGGGSSGGGSNGGGVGGGPRFEWKVIDSSFLLVWVVQSSHATVTMHSGPGVRWASLSLSLSRYRTLRSFQHQLTSSVPSSLLPPPALPPSPPHTPLHAHKARRRPLHHLRGAGHEPLRYAGAAAVNRRGPARAPHQGADLPRKRISPRAPACRRRSTSTTSTSTSSVTTDIKPGVRGRGSRSRSRGSLSSSAWPWGRSGGGGRSVHPGRRAHRVRPSAGRAAARGR